MIQRIQTVYLSLVILALSSVALGTRFFSFLSESSTYVFTSFGITEVDKLSGKLIHHQPFPIFVGLIALILLAFVTLMSYKNLERQFKLGRIVFVLYLLMLVSVLLISMFGSNLVETPTNTREMGLGFFLFVAGFPFSFLANVGIKRDKKLLESLNRLR